MGADLVRDEEGHLRLPDWLLVVELCGLDRGTKVTGAHYTTREVIRILLYSAAAAILDLNVWKPATVRRSDRVVKEDSRVGRLLAI